MDNRQNKLKKADIWMYVIVPSLLFLLILIFSGLEIFLLVNKFGNEDSWICENGKWIKHGRPNAEMPKEGCGEDNKEKDNIKCALYGETECQEKCAVCQPSAKNNLIRLTFPIPNQKISSPLKIEGEARGVWFFEGDFPVVLTDWDGVIIAEGIAKAEASWMTEDFVKFTAELHFEKPEFGETGSLILRKDNPSGLPEYDDGLEIPVVFE